MNDRLPAWMTHPAVSPLARQFARFCQGLDQRASHHCLAAAAWLAECNLSGDTCVELTRFAAAPLWRNEAGDCLYRAPALEQWLRELSAAGFVAAPGSRQPLVLDGNRLYLHRHWRNELAIARALEQRLQSLPVDRERLRPHLEALFGTPSPGIGGWWQKLAAAMALDSRLLLISGGPGTGKTTTITRILALLLEQEPELRVLLAAPTGKAAARLAESIAEQKGRGIPGIGAEAAANLPEQAFTLHRLLGWRRDGFRHHADDPLPCDCLVVDECSMIDQELMARLLDALPPHSRLILLGDRNQLSSVEAGSVFGDLTGSGRPLGIGPARARVLEPLLGELPRELVRDDLPPLADHIAELRHSFRFAAGGGIGRLAAHLGAGEAAAVSSLLQRAGEEELSLVPISAGSSLPGSVLQWMQEAYRPVIEAADAGEALTRLQSARVLCALRQGDWGEQRLGEAFRGRLVRDGMLECLHGPAHGLPVLIRQNDYETGLFNGDTGIFWQSEGELLAWFPGDERLRTFVPAQLPAWQPAWTLTVHRSQGSEYDRVLLVLPPHDSPVLCRELIYTGVTRARRHCTLVCDPELVRMWVARTAERQSGLGERMGYAPRQA